DPRGRIHGLEHVIDEPPELGIELGHRLSAGAQPGVGEFENRSDRHDTKPTIFQYASIALRGRQSESGRDPAHKVDIKSCARPPGPSITPENAGAACV